MKDEEDLRDLRLWSALRLWSGAPTGVRVFGYQAKDIHICE